MVAQNKTLPDGWRWITLSGLVSDPKKDIVDGPFGSNLKASEYVDAGIPIIRLQNIDRNLFLNKKIQFVTPEKAEQLKRHTFQKGDIVITKLGEPLGKACVVPNDFEYGVIVADVVRARINESVINKQYLVLAINSQPIIEQLQPLVKGSTRPRVNLGSIRNLFPPLPEQERIVERIESLFTQLDAGVAGLKRAKAALKRYKASVLKAACEGRLVQQDPNDEPAEEVLKRILAERGEKFTPPDGELGELPKGWCWARVGDLSKVGTGATPLRNQPKYWDNATVPWVTSSALNELFVKSADKFITETALIETNVKVFPAGSLLVAMYGEGRTRGKVSELLIDATTNQACAALIFEGLFAECKPYVKLFFQKNYEDIRRLSSGNVQPNLNLSIIKNTRIPLPPLTEQNRIVAEVERRLSVVQELEQAIEANLKRAGRLRQAILKRAFEGRLVRQ
jgi:type I restriction enzyme, S subunit